MTAYITARNTARAAADLSVARLALVDAQRRVNVAQELADAQAHAIARRGQDCPPAFFAIYRERDERLSKAVEALRARRRDMSDAQQALTAAREQDRAEELLALRHQLTGAKA